MRWMDRKAELKNGDERVIRKFLFFPKKLKGETRWLETVFILQIYSVGGNLGGHWEEWVDDRFLDQE